MLRYLLIVVACVATGSCASGLGKSPRAGTQQCLPGHLLVCEAQHDESSADRDEASAGYEHCQCEPVSF